jgi:hypothetical protein
VSDVHVEVPTIACVMCDRDVTPEPTEPWARIRVTGEPVGTGRGPGICTRCLLALMAARER